MHSSNYTSYSSLLRLQSLEPVQFELYVADLFRAKGYKVRTTSVTGDEGVDLFISKDDEVAVVQCKRYSGTVNPSYIRELYGTMIHSRTTKGYFVTTGRFTRKTCEWVQGKPIVLIDGDRLIQWANQSRSSQKPNPSITLPPISGSRGSFISGFIKFSVGIFVFFFIISSLFRTDSVAPNTDTEPVPMRAIPPTLEVRLDLQQQLSNLDGVNGIERLNTIKSQDGFTIFINAYVDNAEPNSELAKEMLSISENHLDEQVIQFVLFLTDNTRTVNYVWSNTSDRWTVSSREE